MDTGIDIQKDMYAQITGICRAQEDCSKCPFNLDAKVNDIDCYFSQPPEAWEKAKLWGLSRGINND